MTPPPPTSAPRARHRIGAALAVLAVLVALLATVPGCSSDAGGGGNARSADPAPVTTAAAVSRVVLDAACAGTLHVEDAATVTSAELTEASGIAASRRNPGLWWVHNDSGDRARFFAVDMTGALRAIEEVDGATATDWEDLAVGPPRSEGGETIYLADIGDNGRTRSSVQVYRLPEPAVTLDADGATAHVTAEALTLTYPDGAHDAEALIVDPITGDLVVVTKDWSLAGRSSVYRAPADLAAGSTTTLQQVATVDLPTGTLVTAGDVTADGTVVALRSYGGVSLYPRDPAQPLWSAFGATPCPGPVPVEKQGEAIGFVPDGSAYATISEGADPVLHLTHLGG